MEERLTKERLTKERLTEERLTKERLTKERLMKERFGEKERLMEERLKEERLTKERLKEERLKEERLKEERLMEERFGEKEKRILPKQPKKDMKKALFISFLLLVVCGVQAKTEKKATLWSGEMECTDDWSGFVVLPLADLGSIVSGDELRVSVSSISATCDWPTVCLQNYGWADFTPSQYYSLVGQTAPCTATFAVTAEMLGEIESTGGLVVKGCGFTMTEISVYGDVEPIEGDINVWTGSTVMPIEWGAWEQLPAVKFLYAKAGYLLRMSIADIQEGAQGYLTTSAWGAMPDASAFVPLSGGYYQFIITEEMLSELKSNGVIVSGCGYTLTSVDLVRPTKEELRAAIAFLSEYPTHVGKVGGYSAERAAAIAVAIESANEVLGKESPTQDEIDDAYSMAVRLRKPDNMPQAGKYYRLSGGYSGKYLSASSVASADNAPLSADEDASGIFYLDAENRLLNYGQGVYLTQTCQVAGVGESGHKYVFSSSSEQSTSKGLPYLTVRDTEIADADGSWLYENGVVADRSIGYMSDICEWKFEEVVELPVNIRDYEYASANLPTAVMLPEDMTAWYAESESGNVVSLRKIEGVVPANCPVLLHSSNTGLRYLPVVSATEGVDYAGNKFGGTTEAKLRPTVGVCYALSCMDDEVGLYKYTGSYIPGFKAYLYEEEGGTSKIRLKWGDITTAIEASSDVTLEEGVTYSLNGQRVEKLGSGLYIVNGKKIMVK